MLFLHHSNGVEQCYAIVDCVRTYVCKHGMNVTKCHQEQTSVPRRASFGRHIHVDKASASADFHLNRQRC